MTLSHGGRGHLLEGQAKTRADPQTVWPANHAKAAAAAAKSWDEYHKEVDSRTRTGAIVHVEWDRGDEHTPSTPLGPGMSGLRKHAICYFLVEQFGTPEESEWDDFHDKLSLPTIIMRLLNIPSNSKPSVMDAMRAIIAEGDDWDPSTNIKK